MTQRPAAVVVLAAGSGTRMKSKTMKVLHPVCGRSMIGHVLTAALHVDPLHLVAVVGHSREQVGPHILEQVPSAVLAVQETQEGTGHAVRVALDALAQASGTTDGVVVVMAGDTPLMQGETLSGLVEAHGAGQRAITVLTAEVPDPFGYGRIVRDGAGDVVGIVEQKDASPEQVAVREINSGIFAFDGAFLADALARVTNDNAKGEYYLTDVVAIAHAEGRGVGAHRIDDVMQTEGANDRAQLAGLAAELNRRILHGWMRDGVTILDPTTTWIDADVTIEPDVTILPGVQLLGACAVAEDAVIGPDCTLKDVEIGVGAQVVRTHGELAVVGAGATVGPFSYLRPGTELGAGGKIGGFVETKNAQIAAGAQGAAPVLRGRRDDRRGHQHRRRHDLRQLRRDRQAPHDDRPSGPHRLEQHLRGTRRDRRRRGHRGRHRRTPRRAARRAGGVGRPAAADRGLDRPQAPRHPDGRGRRAGGQRAGRWNISAGRPRVGSRWSVWVTLGLAPPSVPDQESHAVSGLKRTTEKNLMVFSGRAHPALAAEVARLLGSGLVPTSAYEFANSEIYVRFEESVRGSDAFVIQSHTAPVNEWIMEHLIMVDALKRASAKRITVVMPFYGYARQDKKHRGREPISARLMADLFKTAGADRLIAVDLHTAQIQGFFDGPVDHLMALPILSEHVKAKYGHERLAVVSPDAGRIKVAEQWSSRLDGAPLAFIHKSRDVNRPNESVANRVVGDVAGRICVLVDDMIDTGGTIVKATEALMSDGAAGVVIAATHAILSDPAVDRLKNCSATEVVVTDTLPIPDDRHFDKLTVLSIAPLISRAIREVFEDGSVTSLFDGHAQ